MVVVLPIRIGMDRTPNMVVVVLPILIGMDRTPNMVVVVQLVRTPGCGPGGRRFESGLPPINLKANPKGLAFLCTNI